MIILFGVPGVCLVLFLCSPVCCCLKSNRKKKYCRAIHNILLSTAEQLFWFLKKEEKDGEKRLIIVGLTAPAGYTYFLLYAFLLLTVHCLFAFFDASVNIYPTVNYPGVKIVPCDELYNYTVNTSSNNCLLGQFQYQIELSPLNGFEASTVTLTVAILTFAFITLFLLKCSGGRKDFKKSCFGRTICGCNLQILLIIQAVFVCTPRAGLIALLYYMRQSEQSVDKPHEWGERQNLFYELSTGILDKESFFTLAAVCDSISTAMLTPWYRFEKKKQKSDSCPMKLRTIQVLVPTKT